MYQAEKDRYSKINYRRCGKSGIQLPEISLGLWHNFGGVDVFENYRSMLRTAFDKIVIFAQLVQSFRSQC